MKELSSIHQTTQPSIHLSHWPSSSHPSLLPSFFHPSIHSSIYLTIHPSIKTSIHSLSIHPSDHHHSFILLLPWPSSSHPSLLPSFIHSIMCPSIHPSIHRSIHRSIHSSIHPSIHHHHHHHHNKESSPKTNPIEALGKLEAQTWLPSADETEQETSKPFFNGCGRTAIARKTDEIDWADWWNPMSDETMNRTTRYIHWI